MGAPSSMPDSVPQIGLAAYLRADAPARERIILRFWVAASLLGSAIGLAVILTQGKEHLSVPIQLLSGCGALYAVTVSWLIGRGWYHPAIIWANVTVEITALGPSTSAGG
jgi:hypothetical protein